MGRTLKRVPMDFDWPLGKVWHGYLNPHYRQCPDCESGYTVARRYLQGIATLIMVAGEDATRGKMHPYLHQIPHAPNVVPSADMAILSVGLAGRDMGSFGHDGCDRWSAEKKIIAAAGLDPETWGICPTCHGEAIDPAIKEAYEAWQEFDPPAGDGYQLWSTTTEGHPMSPAFATLDEVCAWAETNASTFGSSKTSAAEWKRMLTNDFVYHQDGNNIFI